MKYLKNASKSVLAFAISVLMIVSMLPIGIFSVFASEITALETNIDEQTFYVGRTTEFTFTTKASPEDVGKSVLGSFELLDGDLNDASSLVTLEYYDVNSNSFREFSGNFGPADEGFPLTDGATSRFKATFKKAGVYKLNAKMIDFQNQSTAVVEADEIVITVRPYDSMLTTDFDITKPLTNNVPAIITYTATANGHVNTLVAGYISVLDKNGESAADCVKTLEYWDETEEAYKVLSTAFNAATAAFTLTETATLKLRITFGKAGTYTIKTELKDYDKSSLLCENQIIVSVDTNNTAVVTDIKKNFEVNQAADTTYTVVANDYKGKTVTGSLTVTKDGKDARDCVVLKQEEIASGKQTVFYGNFKSDFALDDDAYKFNIAFKETGTYSVLFTLTEKDSGAVIAECRSDNIVADDTQAPVITGVNGNPSTWTKEDITLTVSATDNSGSVAEYSNDGRAWQKKNTFTVSENGTYKFYAKDASGNVSAVSSNIMVTFIDKEAPTFEGVNFDPNDWTNTAVTVTVTASDGNGAGGLSYKLDNGNWQSGNSFEIADNDEHKLYVKDSLGNENSTPLVFTANKYDNEAPIIGSVTKNTDEWVSDKVVITVNATDRGINSETRQEQPVKAMQYKLNNGEWQFGNTFEITSNGKYSIYVKDGLDNTTAQPFEYVVNNIDKTAPVIKNLKSSATGWTYENVTITGVVEDVGSGVDKLQYKINEGKWQSLDIDDKGGFSIEITTECDSVYYFKCVDKVGNESVEEYSKEVKIDKTSTLCFSQRYTR